MLVGCWFLLSKEEKFSRFCKRSLIKHLIYKVCKTSLILWRKKNRMKHAIYFSWYLYAAKPVYQYTFSSQRWPNSHRCAMLDFPRDLWCGMCAYIITFSCIKTKFQLLHIQMIMWYVLEFNILFCSFVILTSYRCLISIAYSSWFAMK